MFLANNYFWTEPEPYMHVIFCLAIILFACKSLGILARRIGLPQVVGQVLAGLLIGPAFFVGIPEFNGLLGISLGSEEMDILHVFSQIGVIFILFSSGLDTNLKEMKKVGVVATIVACAGVLVPLVLGFLIAMCFMPNGFGDITNSDAVFNAIFVGAILTATSVGITVETLRELGKLNSRVGTIILGAAIIDDVLGILVLSIVTSLHGSTGGANIPIWLTFIKVILFFVFAVGVGLIIRYIFKWLGKHYPHHRRTGIYAIALCLIYSFLAEQVFGIAAITGAYMAGLMLSGIDDTEYINKKIITSGYLIFSPIFFAYIGISADFSQFHPIDLVFALCFVLIGIIGKIIGCGIAGKATKHNIRDSYIIGSGMIARGEVALAVYAAGKSLIWTSETGEVLGIDPMIATICLILFSSILCPILLKIGFRNYPDLEEVTTNFKQTMAREGQVPENVTSNNN